MSILRRRARDAHLALIATAVIVGAVAASKSPYFLTTTNLLNLAEAVSILGILAIAQTPVLISGGLDLSIGSISGMAGVTAALTVNHTRQRRRRRSLSQSASVSAPGSSTGCWSRSAGSTRSSPPSRR